MWNTLRAWNTPLACEMPAGVGGFISFHIPQQRDISQFARANYFTSRASEIFHLFFREFKSIYQKRVSIFFNEINPLRGFVKYAPRVKYAFGVWNACGRGWIYFISHPATAGYFTICPGKLFHISRKRDISLVFSWVQIHLSKTGIYLFQRNKSAARICEIRSAREIRLWRVKCLRAWVDLFHFTSRNSGIFHNLPGQIISHLAQARYFTCFFVSSNPSIKNGYLSFSTK